jgi:16S rRNA (adenine(1408)-N(1))-methyltransferase
MFLASDANPDALLETASRAGRKPARGGIGNLICIAEPVDVLARELAGIATFVTVILPWGSLLRGLVLPEIDSLRQLQRLCVPGACVEIVFSYDPARDAGSGSLGGLIHVDELHVHDVLKSAYEAVGFHWISAERIRQVELVRYESSWAKRLAFGRPREVWQLCVSNGSRSRESLPTLRMARTALG